GEQQELPPMGRLMRRLPRYRLPGHLTRNLGDHPGLPFVDKSPQPSTDPEPGWLGDEGIPLLVELLAYLKIGKPPLADRVEQLDPTRGVLHDHRLIHAVEQRDKPRRHLIDVALAVGCHA